MRRGIGTGKCVAGKMKVAGGGWVKQGGKGSPPSLQTRLREVCMGEVWWVGARRAQIAR